MEVLKWKEDKSAEDTFYKIKKINNTYYRIAFTVYYYHKSVKVYIGAASGTKRKHLEDYEANEYPRDGGLTALLWIKKEIDKLPDFLKEYYILGQRKLYICIHWTDSQRRDVYSRLERYGFIFITDERQKTLMKKIQYE